MSTNKHIDVEGLNEQLRGAQTPGFHLYPRFCDTGPGEAMLQDVVSLVRQAAAGEAIEDALVLPEGQSGLSGDLPEDLVSKVFKLHRRPVFANFLNDPRVRDILVETIGTEVDCFLSQFIFKNPGAWGQPWHQDGYYFPFEPARPVTALWLAVTHATLENGCLHVLPGSQNEPVHTHIRDQRPQANHGYVEIVDHDMSASVPCLLSPGDLLVFDSHLMHKSTDNHTNGIRAAMVWHFAAAGTIDSGVEHRDGTHGPSPVNDWMPLIRNGKLLVETAS